MFSCSVLGTTFRKVRISNKISSRQDALILIPLHLRRPASRERREHAWRGPEQLPGIIAENIEVALVRGAEARGDQGAIFVAVPRVVGGEVGKEIGGGLAGALDRLRTNGSHSAGSSVGAVTK